MSSDTLTNSVLEQLDKYTAVDSHVLAAALDEDHQTIVGVIKSLQCYDELIEVEPKSIKKLETTDEGNQVGYVALFKIKCLQNRRIIRSRINKKDLFYENVSFRVVTFKVRKLLFRIELLNC